MIRLFQSYERVCQVCLKKTFGIPYSMEIFNQLPEELQFTISKYFYSSHPLRKRMNARMYQRINKDDINERRKEYYAANKEQINQRIREGNTANRDKIREREHKYREENRDTIRERERKYREEHRDECKEKSRQWRENNQDKVKEYSKQRYQITKHYRQQCHTCECGGKYSNQHKSCHLKSKMHQDYIASQSTPQTLN